MNITFINIRNNKDKLFILLLIYLIFNVISLIKIKLSYYYIKILKYI
jgi:hypothetical protein